jgi:hypothetical protein
MTRLTGTANDVGVAPRPVLAGIASTGEDAAYANHREKEYTAEIPAAIQAVILEERRRRVTVSEFASVI